MYKFMIYKNMFEMMKYINFNAPLIHELYFQKLGCFASNARSDVM